VIKATILTRLNHTPLEVEIHYGAFQKNSLA